MNQAICEMNNFGLLRRS